MARVGVLTTKALGSPGGVAPLDENSKVPLAHMPVVDGGDANYTHYQSSAAANWTVEHGLGKLPSVTVLDSANTVYIAKITHLDFNRLVVSLGFQMTGRAICN